MCLEKNGGLTDNLHRELKPTLKTQQPLLISITTMSSQVRIQSKRSSQNHHVHNHISFKFFFTAANMHHTGSLNFKYAILIEESMLSCFVSNLLTSMMTLKKNTECFIINLKPSHLRTCTVRSRRGSGLKITVYHPVTPHRTVQVQKIGTSELNAGGEWKYPQSLNATETGTSSGCMGHLVLHRLHLFTVRANVLLENVTQEE